MAEKEINTTDELVIEIKYTAVAQRKVTYSAPDKTKVEVKVKETGTTVNSGDIVDNGTVLVVTVTKAENISDVGELTSIKLGKKEIEAVNGTVTAEITINGNTNNIVLENPKFASLT